MTYPGLIPRAEWSKGKKSIGRLGRPMQLPVSTVFIHHTVTAASTDPIRDMWTVNDVGIQRFGMHSYSWNFWPDYVNQEHRVLQGQGGLKGAHTANYNSSAFGLCWIGNYERNVPGHPTLQVMPSMVEYTAGWIGYLIDNKILVPNPTIRHHSQIKSTACPGDGWLENMDRLKSLVSQGYRYAGNGKAVLVSIGDLTVADVQAAYQEHLHRVPSDEEIALWLAHPDAKNFERLVQHIKASLEYKLNQAPPASLPKQPAEPRLPGTPPKPPTPSPFDVRLSALEDAVQEILRRLS